MYNYVNMDSYGITDTGIVREQNEDQYLIATLNKSMRLERTSLSYENQCRIDSQPQGQLFLVADGMGGHKGGRKASFIVADTMMKYVLNLMPWFFRLDREHPDDLTDELKAGLDRCSQKIQKESQNLKDHENMGTTLTLAYVIWPRAYILHIGDSRCYLMRDNAFYQITKDDTVAQTMVDKGKISPEVANQSVWNNILTDYVSAETRDDMNPRVHRINLQYGDTLLLCTDGLTCHLSDDEIFQVLNSGGHAKVNCEELIRRTHLNGAVDNTTIVVSQFNKFKHSHALSVPMKEEAVSEKMLISSSQNEKTTIVKERKYGA